MSPARLTCTLLVLVLAAYSAQGTPSGFPRRVLQQTGPVRRCSNLPAGSTAAADQLLSQGEGSRCADFVKGVRDWKMQSLLRQVSRGKIIVCPGNNALAQRFMKMGLYKAKSEVPLAAINAFRKYVRMGVARKRSTMPVKAGCEFLYVQHFFNEPDRVTVIKSRQGSVKAAVDETEFQYSVLGTGYNAFTGFPLAFGMASLDPGFTLTPVFRLGPEHVKTLSTTGGGCTSQFSSSVYTSASSAKMAITAGLGLSVAMAAGSLSLSASFSMLSQTVSTSQTITINSGAKLYMGGYGLIGGPGGLVLENGFKENVGALVMAAAEDRWDPHGLASLVDNYGTHYIKTVWYGGLASIMLQMTSQSYSTLKSMKLKVDIGAQIKMIQLNINVSYSNEESEMVSSMSNTFSVILIPSSVNVGLTSTKDADVARDINDTAPTKVPTFIDCSQWTTNLMAGNGGNGWKAPVHYTISPISGILAFPSLFPTDWRPVLPTVLKQLDHYLTTCAYTVSNFTNWVDTVAKDLSKTSCPAPIETTEECVVGTFKAKKGGCNTCFGEGDVVGPNCNSTVSVGCNAYTCFCMKKYNNDPDVAGIMCEVLEANNGKQPPLPYWSDLYKKK